ncbi:MAG: type IV pilus modification protein PilV [Proteobacteria bacterium]|nr:type IV pilus modification protein PilV [Ramlibacter sp.]MCA0213675.1 type IV pilus modification protein PilV [Pseudomonadota bacterium]
MLNKARHPGRRCGSPRAQAGVGLIEILVSVLITSFGLLALAGLQSRMGQAQFESYQRAQALTLLADLTQRMQANPASVASYVTASPAGTGDAAPASCASLTTVPERDLCEWSNALKGASETSTSGGTTTNVGAMIGARGCVEEIQAADLTAGICRPAIYRVTVAWQGMLATVAPGVTCGQGLYGTDDGLRKAISAPVVAPLLGCI